MQKIILNTKNLAVMADPVDDLILIDESDSRNKHVSGVVLGNILKIFNSIIKLF